MDDSALAKAIVDILEDEKARESLVKAGLAHVANFSWRKTAEMTWEVYEAVFANGSHSHPASAR
jgi:glycosyltransferase involved in cell wall biosynthesis